MCAVAQLSDVRFEQQSPSSTYSELRSSRQATGQGTDISKDRCVQTEDVALTCAALFKFSILKVLVKEPNKEITQPGRLLSKATLESKAMLDKGKAQAKHAALCVRQVEDIAGELGIVRQVPDFSLI